MDDYHEKHKKKHKKEKKKKKKHSKRSSSDSEDEWVEKEVKKNPLPQENKRDEWMSMEMDFNIYSKKKEKKEEEEKIKKENPIELVGQSSRELNPYWKDGGTGLPPELKKTPSLVSEEMNKYRMRNDEKGNSVKYLDRDEKYKRDHSRRDNTREYSRKDHSREYSRKYEFDNDLKKESSKGSSKMSKSFRKPEYDNDEYFDNSRKDRKYSEVKTDSGSSSSKKGWRKAERKEEDKRETNIREETRSNAKNSTSKMEISEVEDSSYSSTSELSLLEREERKILSLDEMNHLSAKIIKAEIMGNTKLAEELKVQLEKARKHSTNTGKIAEEDEKVREVIVLTETDSKGFTRPLKSIRAERLNSKRKIETHESNKRVRYFADDESLTLKQMYEKEKFGSSKEQNATFVKLMSKVITEKNEDAFEETASSVDTSEIDIKKWSDAINEHKVKDKAMDNCYWCLSSKNMNQDTIVAIRDQVQLCVPSSQSLTDGHCVIVPNEHVSCATNLDEDVWEEIMSIRKILVKVFLAEDEDVIFFECASNLNRYPHMQLHCVPVPKEIGDVAPIYFKKAIMECEMEWSNNKKVVDLAGKNVRKAIPKGLPYFAVDFGMQSGYAHVIEDKRLFPNNFAQEIIGGMLDMDHSKWRKLHQDTQENIEKKAKYLKQLIQKYLSQG